MNRSSPSGPNSRATPSIKELRASRGIPPATPRRFRKWIIAGGVLVALVLFGFFGLPPIVKSQAIKQLSERLGREVTIEKIRVNPLVLSVTIEGFAIAEAEPSAGEFTGWRRLHVNLDSWPLVLGRLRFQTIELDGFRAHVAKAKNGGLNFDDIVARLTAPDPDAPAAADQSAGAEKSGVPPVAIGRLAVTDATVTFDDASRSRAFATAVGPLTFTLENFKTVGDPNSPYQFEAVTEAGERLAWKGTVSADPVKSQGELVLANIDLARLSPYYHDLFAGELRSAFADMTGRYTFELRDGLPHLTMADGAFTLRDLRLGAPGVKQDAVTIKTVSVTGVVADTTTLHADIAKVSVSGVRAKAVRDAQGIDLVRLLTPTPPFAHVAEVATEAVSDIVAAAPSPRFRLGEFSLADTQAEFTDLTTPRPAVHRVENVSLDLRGLDLGDLAKSLPLQLEIAFPDSGKLVVSGAVAALPPAAELDIALDRLPVVQASPYIEPFINARLAGGSLRTRGKATLRDGAVNYAGDFGLGEFHTVDGKLSQDFVKWSDLAVSGIKVGTSPLAFHADLVRLVEPSAAVRVEADGTLSIAQPGAAPSADGKNTAAPAAPPVRTVEDLPATKPTSGPLTGPYATRNPLPLAVTVDRVEIERGAFRFEDRSIRPASRGSLTDFTGSIAGLSTENMGRADLDLKGKVDGVAPVAVTGKLNPLGVPAFLDVKIDFKNIDLQPGAGPYVGKFAGRSLNSGSLSLAITAKLQDRRVDLDNVVTLDQFYLGDSTHSPDATKLPVGLALSLLRDTRGRIVIDVPVQGDMDDPNFRIGRVVVRVLGNILVKAATSPFSLLGAAFGGGGDELGWQDFAAGSSAIDEAGIKKLETVAKALAGRPALRLDLAGAHDPVSDLAALRRTRLDQQVRSAAWEARRQVDPNTPPPEQLEITPELRAGMIARLYTAAFPDAAAQAGAVVVTESGVSVPLVPSPASPSAAPETRRNVGRLPKYSVPARWAETIEATRPAAPTDAPATEPAPGAQETSPTTDAATAAPPPTITLAQMEARLAERVEIPADELQALADSRAQAVRAWLIDTGKIAAERIHLAPAAATGTRVNLDLK